MNSSFFNDFKIFVVGKEQPKSSHLDVIKMFEISYEIKIASETMTSRPRTGCEKNCEKNDKILGEFSPGTERGLEGVLGQTSPAVHGTRVQ